MNAQSVDDALDRVGFDRAPAVAKTAGAVDPSRLPSINNVRFIAGGTNLADLLKAQVERPQRLVNLGTLPYKAIVDLPGGGLRLGALATNTSTAEDPRVAARYPMLAEALMSATAPQIRGKATNGGNLLQRTRCLYFYDTLAGCNKRVPGSGCSAIGGINRTHAIFGASPSCIATHPSDFAVALMALDATVRVVGRGGERLIPFADFHRLPGDTPYLDTNLGADEIITAIDLPSRGFAQHSAYVKVREHETHAFALVSVAAAIELEGQTIRELRLALGGVAHKPWRDRGIEATMAGLPATLDTFAAVADAMMRDAQPLPGNVFKVDLTRHCIIEALARAAGLTMRD